jgi:hypothetical protein
MRQTLPYLGTVPFKEVDGLLSHLGFRRRHKPGSHYSFVDDKSGAVLIFRDHQPGDNGWPPNLLAVRQSLDEFGVLKSDDFDSYLDEVKSRNGKNGRPGKTNKT